jgi:hypothetical protein
MALAMPRLVTCCMTALLCACASVPSTTSPRPKEGDAPQGPLPLGYWQDRANSDYLVAFEGSSLLISYGGRVREVMAGLAVSPGWERVCRFGRDSVFTWQWDGQSLVLHDMSLQETHHLFRLQRKPAALELNNFHVPGGVALNEERIASIRQEIESRKERDQGSLKSRLSDSPSKGDVPSWLQASSAQEPKDSVPHDFHFVESVTENTEYIRKIISEVGWIDVARFGYPTSNSAFLLIQHSWDASLMLAVLPYLKKDVDAGRMEADTYALMFDRLQLSLGLRQRYGSQVAADETGLLVVLPTEDPANVDKRRAGLGLTPLRDYVRIFGAPEVKFSQACQKAP